MVVELISVGTELLLGNIVNTNTQFLAEKCALLGLTMYHQVTVGDNHDRLTEVIRTALKRSDVIILTGGLGPTEDDLTKEVCAEVMGFPLVEDKHTRERIEEYFRNNIYKVIPDNNWKQAIIPEGCMVLDNANGTAPGLILEKYGKSAILLPGPPNELYPLFMNQVFPYLQKLQPEVIRSQMVKICGVGESQVEDKLLDLIDKQKNPTIATYAKEGECSLRIASKRGSLEEAQSAVDEVIEKISDRVGEYIYSYDDEELAQVVGKKLIDRNITISACESCTGGLFAGALTSVSGISQVFDRSLVTYTYNAKMKELGVKEETLSKYTAESSQVASEMVCGLKEKTGSRICVSVTGLTGPGGGTPEKPVGLIYIGCIFDDRLEVKEIRMRNVNREWNRPYAVLHMLDIVNKMLAQKSV